MAKIYHEVATQSNSFGTLIAIPETDLLTREVTTMRRERGAWVLKYKNPEHHGTPLCFHLPRIDSAEFGVGFQVGHERMRILLPETVRVDPLHKLAVETVRKISHESSAVGQVGSLFYGRRALSLRQQMVGLLLVKQMLDNEPTREIRTAKRLPKVSDVAGKGKSFYVLVGDPQHQKKTKFWHIDRTNDTPKFTELSLNKQQFSSIQYLLFRDEKPDPKHPSFDLYSHWSQLGENSENSEVTTSPDGHISIILNEKWSKEIPKLLLSDVPALDYFVEDWKYGEASNRLTHVLNTRQETPSNRQFLQRCHGIQRQLDKIGEDFYKAHPKTRGIVPHEKRMEMMNMLATMVSDPDSVEAKHYFRTKHRVHHEAFDLNNIEEYEPSSFVWFGRTLHYVDQYKKVQEVLMTPSILEKLEDIERHAASEGKYYISADDVYYLMTKPRLFHYVHGIPVCFDCRWIDFKYFVPWGFDRNKGLHTGTAQEIVREIYDMKLSVSALLYKVGVVIMWMAVASILAALGIQFPLTFLALNAIQMMLFEFTMMVWNAVWVFKFLAHIIINNEILQPELNQLDEQLKALGEDFDDLQQHRPPRHLMKGDEDVVLDLFPHFKL